MCDLNNNVWVMVPFIIIMLYFIFKFICALVDEYIAASIEYIVDEFKISDALAGVTLIALANGAGDVVTAIVASGSADGVAYNVGALFGAGLFVCTIVMTFTIMQSRKKKGSTEYDPIIVDKWFIYRDIGCYIIATITVLLCGLMGKITWWTSAIMLLIYCAFVAVVYFQEKSKATREEAEKKAAEEAEAAHKKDDDNEKEDPEGSKMGAMFGGKAFKNTMRKAITLSV
jgi:sodium/potassium/calcium exchanger 6